MRVQVTPKRYRVETIILPLIHNSLYGGLSMVLGGEPEAIDLPPVPNRSIFSAGFKWNKERLLEQIGWNPPPQRTPVDAIRREQRVSLANRLKQIGLAMHNYHDTHRTWPGQANFDQEKRPLLSWRVHLLPYMGLSELYEKFHLDEPWDSPHNRALLNPTPVVYRLPGERSGEGGRTGFLRPTGSSAICMGKNRPTRIADVRDGTSNTILVISAQPAQHVPWSKPVDVSDQVTDMRRAMFGDKAPSNLVTFADGSTREIQRTVKDADLTALTTRGSGEVIDSTVVRPTFQRRRRNFLFDFEDLSFGSITERDFYDLITRGVGDRVSMHTYDADLLFDFQLVRFLGQAVGQYSGQRLWSIDDDLIPFTFLGASLNSPVYVSIPLDDSELVDQFMEKLDSTLAEWVRTEQSNGFIEFSQDFYRLPLKHGVEARSYGIQFGPVKWRVFWARINQTLYIASKPYILEDLAASDAEPKNGATPIQTTSTLKAHAIVRLRAKNWNQVLPTYRLGWAERHRQSCFDNVGRLQNVRRWLSASSADSGSPNDRSSAELLAAARDLYGLQMFCPAGGIYASDKETIECTLHGSARSPRQPAETQSNQSIDWLLRDVSDVTVTLTFLEDGLHAVMLVDRPSVQNDAR